MFTKHVVVEDGCIDDNNLKQHYDLSFYLSTWRLNQSGIQYANCKTIKIETNENNKKNHKI